MLNTAAAHSRFISQRLYVACQVIMCDRELSHRLREELIYASKFCLGQLWNWLRSNEKFAEEHMVWKVSFRWRCILPSAVWKQNPIDRKRSVNDSKIHIYIYIYIFFFLSLTLPSPLPFFHTFLPSLIQPELFLLCVCRHVIKVTTLF